MRECLLFLTFLLFLLLPSLANAQSGTEDKELLKKIEANTFDAENEGQREALRKYLIATPDAFENGKVLLATERAAQKDLSIITANTEVQTDWFDKRNAHCAGCTLKGIEPRPDGTVNARFDTQKRSVIVENLGGYGPDKRIIADSTGIAIGQYGRVTHGVVRQDRAGRVEVQGALGQRGNIEVNENIPRQRYLLTNARMTVNAPSGDGSRLKTIVDSANGRQAEVVVHQGTTTVENGFRVTREEIIGGKAASLTFEGTGKLQFHTRMVNGVAIPMVSIYENTNVGIVQEDGRIRTLTLGHGTIMFSNLLEINQCQQNCLGISAPKNGVDGASMHLKGMDGIELAFNGDIETLTLEDIGGNSKIDIVASPSLLRTSGLDGYVFLYGQGGSWNLRDISYRGDVFLFSGETAMGESAVYWKKLSENAAELGTLGKELGALRTSFSSETKLAKATVS